MSTTTKAQVRQWLETNVNGTEYIKSYEIANDLDCSAKSVGTKLEQMQSSEGPFDIEQWGYSSATTWQVQRRE